MTKHKELFGWSPNPKEVSQVLGFLKSPLLGPASYNIRGDGKGKSRFLWKAVEQVLGQFNVRQQGTSDCTSFATAACIDALLCVNIAWLDSVQVWEAECATESNYALSRVEVGGGKLRGPGSYGAWCAKAAQEYGHLIRKKYSNSVDLRRYSAVRADQWGYTGLPDDLEPIARLGLVRTVSLVSSYSEAIDSLYYGYPINVCSNSSFSYVRDKNGFAEYTGENWPHSMAVLGYDDDPKHPGVLCQNCFSDDTEILTENGWKLFKDLIEGEKVATFNTETKNLEYQLPTAYQEYDYNGPMIHFKGRLKDCLVTPEHNMLTIRRFDRERGIEKYKFIAAQDIGSRDNLIRNLENYTGGQEVETIEICGYTVQMDDWLQFLGYFLSEGWATVRTRERIRKKNQIVVIEKDGYCGIAQNSGEILDSIIEVTSRLPWKFTKQKLHGDNDGYQIICYNTKFAEYMSQFGKAHEKFIPEYVFKLPRVQQRLIFKTLMEGDGSKSGTSKYHTNSEKLRDGFQRLAIQLGYVSDWTITREQGTICEQERNGKTISVVARHTIYSVLCSSKERVKVSTVGEKREIDYNGKVYCVTVPNHTVVVRRNGKMLVTGQSWGPDWISGPKRHEQPEGSFWIHAEIFDHMLKSQDSFCYSDLMGYEKRKLDLRII